MTRKSWNWGLVISLFFSFMVPLPTTQASEKPTIESFDLNKYEFDLLDKDLRIEILLTVSHSSGIADRSTTFIFGKDSKFSQSAVLERMDNPIDFTLKKVTFRGVMEIPRHFPKGVYFYEALGVSANATSSTGRISTGIISGQEIRELYGAEKGVLVRSDGYLDLDTRIINGPSYGNQNGRTYVNPHLYLGINPPIWRAKENFELSQYIELVDKSVAVEVESKTPSVCSAQKMSLSLISQGLCTYVFRTIRNKNYKSQEISDTNTVDAGRSIQELFVDEVPKQNPTSFPFAYKLNNVYSSGLSSAEFVFPESLTKDICGVSAYNVTIISGGICKLAYQSIGNDNFLPSKLYIQEIIIRKINQNINFVLPERVELKKSSLQLDSKAEGSRTVYFKSVTPSICSISTNSEKLELRKAGLCKVEATQKENSIYEESKAEASVYIVGDKEKFKNKKKKNRQIKS